MRATQKITSTELANILKEKKGVVFAHLVLFTDEYGSRTINKKRALQKLTFRNVTIGANYEAKVNRILENKQGEEGNFESEAMSGKTFEQGTNKLAFMDKDNTVKYLVCDVEKRTKTVTKFIHEGKPIAKDKAIELNLFAPSYFTQVNSVGRGSIEDENKFNRLTPKLTNILSIKFNKVRYIIQD